MFHVEHCFCRIARLRNVPRGTFRGVLSPALGRFFVWVLHFLWAALGCGQLCAGWPRHRPPPHAAFRTRCTPTVQRVSSKAHYAAAVPRLARLAPGGRQGKIGQSAPCLAGLLIQTREHHPAEAEPGPPHVVRIRTDTFLCSEKCSGCRVRWRWAGRSTSIKAARLLSPGDAGVRAALCGVAASLLAAARGVSNTLHSHRAACSLRGALRGGSSAAGSAFS